MGQDQEDIQKDLESVCSSPGGTGQADGLGNPSAPAWTCPHQQAAQAEPPSLHLKPGPCSLMGKELAPALQTGHSLVLQSFTWGESYPDISGYLDRSWTLQFPERWQLGLVFLQH